MLKNNIRGGPSIFFHRYQEGDKLCKNIIGFDANALYFWAIMQNMPVGINLVNRNKLQNIILMI
jgi:hypothetical protein